MLMIRKLAARDHRLATYKYYDLLVHMFVVTLLVSNLVGSKISAIGPFHLFGYDFSVKVSGAQLLFPIAYIFGDIFTEVYGYAGSRRAIWIGFGASALLAAMSLFIVWVPPAPDWRNQAAFETVFNVVPRMIAASLIAYWCGEFANSYVMAKMKIWTRGRRLWARTIGSTAVGQAVDSTTVIVLAFAGRESWSTIVNLIISGYIAKVLYEAAATPVTYLVVNSLKRAEGVDVYDEGTDFNPFSVEENQRSPERAAGV
jgi:queuosine precursor transporter